MSNALDLMTLALIPRLGEREARAQAEAEARRAADLGVALVGRGDADYPAFLRQIFDAPAVLYVRGRMLGGEGETSVAIVGSRSASPLGTAFARALAADLARSGLTIVSGLARGIDTAAHLGALDAGGRTVAVLGSGLDRLYPPENAGLAAAIVAAQGAVVSELPLGSAPYPSHFPRRNRIIAGWGRGVVVVEAQERSGALVTARLALEEGRDVLAVPGHPSYPGAAGTNALIRDGAVLVRGAGDVTEALGIASPVTEDVVEDADRVLGALRKDAPSSLEQLLERVGGSASDLLARLAELEIESKVRRLPGSLFVRH